MSISNFVTLRKSTEQNSVSRMRQRRCKGNLELALGLHYCHSVVRTLDRNPLFVFPSLIIPICLVLENPSHVFAGYHQHQGAFSRSPCASLTWSTPRSRDFAWCLKSGPFDLLRVLFDLIQSSAHSCSVLLQFHDIPSRYTQVVSENWHRTSIKASTDSGRPSKSQGPVCSTDTARSFELWEMREFWETVTRTTHDKVELD